MLICILFLTCSQPGLEKKNLLELEDHSGCLYMKEIVSTFFILSNSAPISLPLYKCAAYDNRICARFMINLKNKDPEHIKKQLLR